MICIEVTKLWARIKCLVFLTHGYKNGVASTYQPTEQSCSNPLNINVCHSGRQLCTNKHQQHDANQTTLLHLNTRISNIIIIIIIIIVVIIISNVSVQLTRQV